MGMIENAVKELVAKIATDDVQMHVKNEINNVLSDKLADVIGESLDTERKKIAEKLEEKFAPVYVKIDKIDIEDAIDDQLDTFEEKIKGKVTEIVSAIDGIEIDVTSFNKQISENVGEMMVDISEDDEDVLLKLARDVLGEDCEELIGEYEMYIKACAEDDYDTASKYDCHYQDVASKVASAMGWECEAYTYEEPDSFYLGREPSTIKDDETGKQFKDSVKEVCDKYKLGTPSYMDGEIQC